MGRAKHPSKEAKHASKEPKHAARTSAETAARAARVAQEMRKNLLKRKAQQRAKREKSRPE
jgi:hypothetical protein